MQNFKIILGVGDYTSERFCLSGLALPMARGKGEWRERFWLFYLKLFLKELLGSL